MRGPLAGHVELVIGVLSLCMFWMTFAGQQLGKASAPHEREAGTMPRPRHTDLAARQPGVAGHIFQQIRRLYWLVWLHNCFFAAQATAPGMRFWARARSQEGLGT